MQLLPLFSPKHFVGLLMQRLRLSHLNSLLFSNSEASDIALNPGRFNRRRMSSQVIRKTTTKNSSFKLSATKIFHTE